MTNVLLVIALLFLIFCTIKISFLESKINDMYKQYSINSNRIEKIFYSIRILLQKEYNININEFCEKYTALLNERKEAVNNKGDEEQ